MERQEVIKLLGFLTEFYPRRMGSGDAELTAQAWGAVLLDADAESVMTAAIAWVRSDQPHPPTPGQLAAQRNGSGLTASEAWGTVISAIRDTGYAEEPDLPDETMTAIRAVGGDWGSMCKGLESRDVPSLRARFLEAYENIGARKRQSAIESGASELVRRIGGNIGLIGGA